ncbi:MAG: hypothetical protein AAF203_02960 [Pseudomonadota bacterium]
MLRNSLSVFVFIGTIFSVSANASVKLTSGTFPFATDIDAIKGEAYLSLEYEGCEEPKPESVTLTPDLSSCNSIETELAQEEGKVLRSGKIGMIKLGYNNSKPRCSKGNQGYRKKTFFVKRNVISLYDQFRKAKCYPDHLAIYDSEGQAITRDLRDKTLCEIPKTKVTKEGFPTEDYSFFSVRANDKGFQVGDHTFYRYDHNSGAWEVSFKAKNQTRCGATKAEALPQLTKHQKLEGDPTHRYDEGKKQWCATYNLTTTVLGKFPQPLPIRTTDRTTGETRVHAVVNLTTDSRGRGVASIKAMPADAVYANTKELWAAQKRGDFRTKVDKSKGYLDFVSMRDDGRDGKPGSGMTRTIARSYLQEDGVLKHQKAVHFVPREVFGTRVTQGWCDKEHCFSQIQSSKIPLCESFAVNTKYKGNLCHSCLGMMPGHCATNRDQANFVRENLIQNENFELDNRLGEPVKKKSLLAGLLLNYDRIIKSPANPGCYEGTTPEFAEEFDPARSSASTPEKK